MMRMILVLHQLQLVLVEQRFEDLWHWSDADLPWHLVLQGPSDGWINVADLDQTRIYICGSCCGDNNHDKPRFLGQCIGHEAARCVLNLENLHESLTSTNSLGFGNREPILNRGWFDGHCHFFLAWLFAQCEWQGQGHLSKRHSSSLFWGS